MTNNDKEVVKERNWFRIFARIIGGIVGLFFFLTIAMALASGSVIPDTDIMYILCSVAVPVGVIIAWRREKIGGILLIIVYAIAFFFYINSL
ncbi:MAG: hypothetical protein NT066_07155 [Candidatus Omnitrophica bacterium]|nr:hypothetical protein [Candidatus Omnitrophota bacterium]